VKEVGGDVGIGVAGLPVSFRTIHPRLVKDEFVAFPPGRLKWKNAGLAEIRASRICRLFLWESM